MAIVNHSKREINAKIVYFGHEGAGKGTSLRYVYDRIKPTLRGELKSLPTAGSALLFFDFSPFEQPVLDGYRIRFHIYTLHGRVANPAAWRMTLKGTDGLVFVADAAAEAFSAAQHSLRQLRDSLNSYGVGLDDIPLVLQLNKADRAGEVAATEVAAQLGLAECNACLTTALSGDGVLEALTTLSRRIMVRIRESGDLPPDDGCGADNSADDTADAAQPVSRPLAPEQVADVVPDVAPVSAFPDGLRVSVAETGVSVEEGTVRIPLEIAHSSGVQRLVVTVMVAPG
ncbi:MAG: hypothetical protein HYV06_06355 [Deltaproteobacteria bacterium]|nr:hypothetical protein [Deltaproteobacteria bacterium]